jgi:hypothetical protein
VPASDTSATDFDSSKREMSLGRAVLVLCS